MALSKERHGREGESNFPCPICGAMIDSSTRGYVLNHRCPDCESLLWCRKRVEQDSVLLDVIPGTRPEISDIATIGQSLRVSPQVSRVVINLRDVEIINSSFVAGMLVMRRLVEAAGGRLVLSDLRPRVHVILQRLKLHTLFIIRGCA